MSTVKKRYSKKWCQVWNFLKTCQEQQMHLLVNLDKQESLFSVEYQQLFQSGYVSVNVLYIFVGLTVLFYRIIGF